MRALLSPQKNVDIIGIADLAVAILSFLAGDICYVRDQPVKAACLAFVCAFFFVDFAVHFFHGRYLNMPLSRIDRLKGEAFEQYLAFHFRRKGYRVTITDSSHDYGADLVLRRLGRVTVIQAKRYERNVGISAVQEVIGAVAWYKADRAMVITNHDFTKSAKRLAAQNEVELWGRDELKKYFHAAD